MPKALELKLKAEAKKKGMSKKKAGAYVYGTLRKTGWTPKKKSKKIKKGFKVGMSGKEMRPMFQKNKK